MDHNPSSVTSTDSFHGTAHSLCQHPTADNEGQHRGRIQIDKITADKTIPPLPTVYTNILPTKAMPKQVKAPIFQGPMRPESHNFVKDRENDEKWLERVESLMNQGSTNVEEFVSWAAFHTSVQTKPEKLSTQIALMPLLRDPSHSFATIIHCLKTNRNATELLNPGQVPVLTMDQPLYSIGKQIQWNSPDLFGEDKYVVMMRPLHIEMAGLKMLGDLLEGSGWCEALAQANVAGDGSADSVSRWQDQAS